MSEQFVVITRVVTLTYTVPLAHYPGMTRVEALQAEIDKTTASVVEELAMADTGVAMTSMVMCGDVSRSRTSRD